MFSSLVSRSIASLGHGALQPLFPPSWLWQYSYFSLACPPQKGWVISPLKIMRDFVKFQLNPILMSPGLIFHYGILDLSRRTIKSDSLRTQTWNAGTWSTDKGPRHWYLFLQHYMLESQLLLRGGSFLSYLCMKPTGHMGHPYWLLVAMNQNQNKSIKPECFQAEWGIRAGFIIPVLTVPVTKTKILINLILIQALTWGTYLNRSNNIVSMPYRYQWCRIQMM